MALFKFQNLNKHGNLRTRIVHSPTSQFSFKPSGYGKFVNVQRFYCKKRHHHALSVISTDEDAVYDITIDKQDFHHTLEESLIAYEEEEKYEKCAEIKKAMDFLDKKKAEKAVSSIVESLAT